MPLEQLGVKGLAQGHIGVSQSLTPKACVLSTAPSPLYINVDRADSLQSIGMLNIKFMLHYIQ